MPRVSIALTVLAAALLSVVFPRSARAEAPNQKAVPIYVLSILTDDADDQADALTQALRTRVRQAPGLSLLETPQSLETLTIALRCPPRPDGPCLQRIGDQLHADHYIWGSLGKKKGGQVEIEAHFWSRGKGQNDATETFSDNLKDPSDDALRSVASKLVAELTGTGSPASSGGGGSGAEGATGTLVVHAGSGGGSVMVDGTEKGTLDGGTARVEVSEGSHTVTVHVPGSQAPSLTTTVKAGGEQEVSFALAPRSESDDSEGEPSKPFPTRKVVAYSALGVAAVLITVAAVEGLGWLSDKSDSDNQRANIPANVGDACGVGTATPNATYAPAAAAACNDSKDAQTKSTISWVTGVAGLAAGGVGVWLLTTDHDADSSASASSGRFKPRVGVSPLIGQHEGGLRLRVQF
jgi:hypothetical protein